MDEDAPKLMMRPNDLCSAAYFGDVEKLKELLAANIEPVEEEPPLEADFDPAAPADEEALAAAADRSQRRKANEEEVRKRLSTQGLLLTRQTAVNVRQYGLLATAQDQDVVPSSNSKEGGSTWYCMSAKWKPSKRSQYAAPPLLWAVLGREHQAIRFLVLQGADTLQPSEGIGLLCSDVLRCNDLQETAKVLHLAIQEHNAKREKDATIVRERDAELQRREQARLNFAEEQRQKEEEERLQAEREAAGEANAEAAPQDDE